MGKKIQTKKSIKRIKEQQEVKELLKMLRKKK